MNKYGKRDERAAELADAMKRPRPSEPPAVLCRHCDQPALWHVSGFGRLEGFYCAACVPEV